MQYNFHEDLNCVSKFNGKFNVEEFSYYINNLEYDFGCYQQFDFGMFKCAKSKRVGCVQLFLTRYYK